MTNMAHELIIGDVYLSPSLLVFFFAFVMASVTAILLNKIKVSHYMLYPSLNFICIMVLYMALIDRYIIKF